MSPALRAAALLLLLPAAPALARDPKPERPPIDGTVVRVLDGDTIEVMDGARPRRVRLYGVDCPEKRQPFGSAAKRMTSSLVAGRRVSVKVKDVDRYGREVGIVVLATGLVLNEELVKAGFAWWYRRYAPKDERLAVLEEQARAARRGLWSAPSPEEPWLFRRKRRLPETAF